MLNGIDVSEWQGKIDWTKVKSAGIAFVFIRASHGRRLDKRVRENWRGCKRAGILCGLYHYLEAEVDARTQANVFLQIAKELGVTAVDLPPVLDVEDDGGKNKIPNRVLQVKVATWLIAVANAMKRKPIIYTGPYFWKDHMGKFDTTPYSLWVAHYYVQKPMPTPGFKQWTFWQRSDRGKVPGITGNVDLDHFAGDRPALRDFLAKSVIKR